NRRGGRRQSGGSKSRGQNESRTKRESCANHKARKQDADMRGYSIGNERGASPRGNAFSMRAISSADNFRWSAPALSAAWAIVAAFGIANTDGRRARKLNAT